MHHKTGRQNAHETGQHHQTGFVDINGLPQYIIKGCQSKVWLRAEQQDGRVYFWADSDAIITKGIVSVLIRAFSGLSAQDIVNAPTDFIKEIGLNDHLSPTRANGLVSMIKQMKLYSTAFAAQNNA